MEDYIIEISKYYFKGVLENNVIQKVLSKKEEKFPIQEKVVKELDDLKEFILEMSKLNFPLDSIKEGVDSFIRDTEYLQKTPNLNIDIEDILEDSLIKKTENIENNEITAKLHIIVAYGVSISAVAENLIENVRYKVEEFTGM